MTHLKTGCYILLLLSINSSLFSQQFYIRGEVKDEAGNALQNVTILQQRTGYVYRTGTYGSFGILTDQQTDTLTFSLDGYQQEKIKVSADNYVNVKLKILSSSASYVRRSKLSSLTLDLERNEQKKWFAGDETYASLVENHFVNAKRYPTTGITLNIDRASYSNIRRFINLNTFVPPDAVRIEEMLNYFNLDYNKPDGNDVFKIKTTLTSCPWAAGNDLFFINLSSRKINFDTLPPSNLVFLIDISGSMDMPNRLPLLKSAFRLLVNNLRAKDTVSIVVYGGTVGIMLQPTSGGDKEKILKAIDELAPGGSTPGESGIRLAYRVAQNNFIKGGNNRVILATDGDFNVGLKTEDDLDKLISMHRESGIYLTCLGVGMGNYKDSKIQTLARRGNGNFAYLDNFQEAEKVLLKEFSQTLYGVADDVYMNVEFNPDLIEEYRLIGFDNKVGALSDTLSEVEGGEIGSGNSMMAVFEVTPTKIIPDSTKDSFTNEKIANIKLQYRNPGDSSHLFYSYSSPFRFIPFNELSNSYRFSTAVIMFGSLLRDSPFTKSANWDDVYLIAEASANDNDPSQKEFVDLVQRAKALYSKHRKRKRGSIF